MGRSRANEPRRIKILRMLIEAKSRPCVDCGCKLPPECMDLDHVRGPVPRVGNGQRRSWLSFSVESLKEELAKCEVRCPTCHRVRHYLLRLEGLE